MENFKEFQGKDLDDCINQARVFYDLPREKLEIEIIQDAKSGIFGIVGARKAKIRARKVMVAESARNIFDKADDAAFPRPSRGESPLERNARPRSRAQSPRFKPETRKVPRHNDAKPAKVETRPKEEAFIEDDILENEGASSLGSPLEVDKEALEKSAREIVSRLLTPIAGKELELSVEVTPGAARVKAPWEGDAGLLIGREGQTLAAVQYIASRILSREMNAPLKLQIDIGDYRSRQEDKLCELARSLAEKAQSQGRPFSTRPLSSFHRRIVHLCLQDFEDIQTRSSGDGPLKKVLIFPRKNGRS